MYTAEELKEFYKAQIAANPLIQLLSENPDFDNSIIGQFTQCIANVMVTRWAKGYAHMAAVEDVIAYTNPHSAPWIQKKAFEFQYDAEAPQVLVQQGQSVGYETIDESLRPVVHCAVKTLSSRTATIRVLGEGMAVLDTDVVKSLKSYFNSVRSVSNSLMGINADVDSVAPDLCYIKGVVYYTGQKSATIEENVTAAIEAYLAAPRLDGNLNSWGLSRAVMAVWGVYDFVIEDLAVRKDGDLFSANTYIIDTFVDQNVSPASTSGFYITETDPGNELSAKLTFTPAY